jgi:hypothetical protein
MLFFNYIKNNKFFFFLLICFIYNAVQIYQFTVDKYAYQYGDWLINYSNGFVRRGLGGEVIFYFSYLFNKNIQISYFVILIILLSIFYYKSFLYLSKINFNFYIKILISSPFLFLFFTLNHKSGVRKEILLYIYIIFLLNSLCKENIKKVNWKYIFFFPILLLVHEGLFFFIPFVILIILSVIDKNNKKKIFFQLIIFILLTFGFVLLIFLFKGDANSANVICTSLKQYAYQNCASTGAISWLTAGVNIYTKQTLFFHDHDGYIYWLINIIYGFFPLLLIIFSNNFAFNKKNYLLNFLNIEMSFLIIIFFIILILFVTPLFLLAIDWGRWLSIIYHLFFFIIIFFLKKKIIFFKKKYSFKLVRFLENNSKIFLLIIFFYSHFLIPGVFYIKDVNKFMSLNFAYINLYNNFKKTFSKY